MGNPKKMSKFICCKCMKENGILSGIQRLGKQRGKFHIKDALCLNKGCNKITKNVEVRYCDDFLEILDRVPELHIKYYGE